MASSHVPDYESSLTKLIEKIKAVDLKIEARTTDDQSDESTEMQLLNEKRLLLSETNAILKHGNLNKAAHLDTLSQLSDHAINLFLKFDNTSRRLRRYAFEQKQCFRIYSDLNNKLVSDLQILKSQFESNDKLVNEFVISKEEIHQIENKIKRYHNLLDGLEKKNPWLKDTDMNLSAIMSEAKKLELLRQQHAELQSEIDEYHGLKPDLMEARNQLAAMKAEFEKLNQQNK